MYSMQGSEKAEKKTHYINLKKKKSRNYFTKPLSDDDKKNHAKSFSDL